MSEPRTNTTTENHNNNFKQSRRHQYQPPIRYNGLTKINYIKYFILKTFACWELDLRINELVRKQHCAKNNLSLRMKTEPVTVWRIWPALLTSIWPRNQTYIPCCIYCIYSNRDRLYLYAEIQITFGTVCTVCIGNTFFGTFS